MHFWQTSQKKPFGEFHYVLIRFPPNPNPNPNACSPCQVKERLRAERHKIGELGIDAFTSLTKIFRDGHISFSLSQQRKHSQKTLGGATASARAAKYPAVELYDRLGLQHCLPIAMRAKFSESSVHEMKDRRRAYLIRVATPLVKVGGPNPNPHPHPHPHPHPNPNPNPRHQT